MKFGITLAMAGLALSTLAERQPFSRYQSIIDRQMFGKPPPGFDPSRPPSEVSKSEQRELTKEQEKLQSSIHFSVIRVSPEGVTQIGFTDNSDPKAPKHYVLAVGEQSDGWLVKEADPVEGSMTIVKDDIEVSLKIGDNSGKGGGTTARAGANRPAPGGSPNARSSLRSSNGMLGGGTLRSRRQMRMQAEREEREKAAADAAAKAAQERAERELQQAQDRAEREQMRAELEALKKDSLRARELNRQNAEKAKAEDGEEGKGE